MAFQSGAFQADAFQQTDPAPPVIITAETTGGWIKRDWWPVERPLEEDRPPPQEVIQYVAKEAVAGGWTEQLQLFRLKAELEAVGKALNAEYIRQFEKVLAAKKAADDDDEEAISLLI